MSHETLTLSPFSQLAGLALAGWLLWPFVEYGVHGVLSHRFRTFVTPLHGSHHREPRAVFTSPAAWVPLALVVWGALVWPLGAVPALAFTGGLLAGFFRYEYVHWRIHFRAPRNARERRRREHHLAHHFVDPKHYHGVTTRLTDRLFGSLPEHWERDYARVAEREPLEGRSNWLAIWRLRFAR